MRKQIRNLIRQEKSEKTSTFIRVVWPFVYPYRWIIVLGYAASLASALMLLGLGLWINANLDPLLADPKLPEKVTRYFGISLMMIGFYAVVTYIHSYAMRWMGTHVVRKMRHRLFQIVLGRGGSVIDEDSSGELQTRLIADTISLGNFLGNELPGLLIAILNLVFGIAGAIYVRPQSTGMGELSAMWMLLLVPLILVMRMLRRLGERTQAALAQAGRNAGEAFRNWPIVHAFNQLDRENQRFGDAVDSVTRYALASLRLRLGIGNLIMAALWGGVVWMILFQNAQLDPESTLASIKRGPIVAFVLFLVRAIGAGLSLVNLVTSASTIVGRTTRIVELLQLPETHRPRGVVHSKGGAEVGEKLSKEEPAKQELQSPVRIMLEEVCYRYRTRDRDALTDVSFEIAPGSRVALVGPSGSGKSTLFSVLLRLVEPTSGRMLGNGLPATGYDIEEWRAEFGFVPQAEYLVSGTVADNISYGVPNASRRDIEAAAELAYARVFIETLPSGYDTDLGEVGSQLSGGQKQRINLARAILTRPSIYLLDEATSSLDPESEEAVQAAINELAKTSTVFVIAHRLHTVRSADQIVVMNNGAVVDMGDHYALAGREPLYQSLIRAYRQ